MKKDMSESIDCLKKEYISKPITHMHAYESFRLRKALSEANFNMNPDNESESIYPLIASIYITIKDLLIHSKHSKNWESYFQFKNFSSEIDRAIILILKDERWQTSSDEERKKIITDHLPKYICNDIELNELLPKINDAFKEL